MKRRDHHRRRTNGYSILETLVSIFIVTIIVGVLGSMFLVLLRSYVLYSTKGALLVDAARMVDRIGNAVRPSFGIEATRDIESTSYTSDDDTVILKTESLDALGKPISGTFDYVVYTRDQVTPSLLRELIDADPASARRDENRILGDNVEDLTFLYKNGAPADSTNVYVSVTVAKDAADVRPTFTLHLDAKIRNK